MWGAGKVLLVIIGIIVSLIVTGQYDNSRKIAENSSRIAQHESDMNDGLHKLEKVITIMSINQKRQMQDAGIHYIDPEPIVHGDG